MAECCCNNKKLAEVYHDAFEYLKDIVPSTVNLEAYFISDRIDYCGLEDIFEQFVQSAQNYQMMPKVINYKDRREKVKDILSGFDVRAVAKMDPSELYEQFVHQFGLKESTDKRNSWRKWSKSIVESAQFLCEFRNVDDFVGFVKCFDYNVHTRMALPLLISNKIHGIGFALACDLLKELGFTSYPKPDVHLIEVFNALGLSKAEPIDTFEAIVHMSDACRKEDPSVTPYKVDKVFWLICSGRLYLENPEMNIGGHKKAFIEHMKQKAL